ncbi:hypothetical protein [Nocardia sp. NPDC049149]|uniref:hypothetical protein n=1 Tax=Nocardia sp. NPDC049149 TaxID=3364315 RepID=UPI0037165E2A
MKGSAEIFRRIGQHVSDLAEQEVRGLRDGLNEISTKVDDMVRTTHGDDEHAGQQMTAAVSGRATADLPRTAQQHPDHSPSSAEPIIDLDARAGDTTAASDPTRAAGSHQPDQPTLDADADDDWRRNPMTLDLDEPLRWITDVPSTNRGQRDFTFTPNKIDDDAVEYLGYNHCHFLSAAIHRLTGWDIVSIDQLRDGKPNSVHSAVLTPEGELLDVFGRADVETATAELGADSHRVVAVGDMPGDVVIGVDHLRGDPIWWATANQRQVVEVVSHFARCVLRENGYGDLVD